MNQLKSKQEYLDVLAGNPEDAEANEGLAKLLLDEGDTRAAIPYVMKCVKTGYANQRIRNFAAHHHAHEGEFDKAWPLVEGASVPTDEKEREVLFETYLMIGNDALESDDVQTAYEVSKRAMDIPNIRVSVVDPIIVRAAIAMAEKYLPAGRPDDALDAIKMAERFAPGNPKLTELERKARDRIAQVESDKKRQSSAKIIGIVIPALIVVVGLVAIAWIGSDWLKNKNMEPDIVAPPPPAASGTEGTVLAVADEVDEKSKAMAEEVETMSAEDFFSNRWLESQQKGDMAEHASLLSEDFVGVTRPVNRDKASEYEKEIWVKKRAASLDAGVEISVSEIKVEEIGGGEVKVNFDYQWKLDHYCDRGMKFLKMKPEGDAWLVYREETVTAEECIFPSESTFRTFVEALAWAVRAKQWSYVKDHIVLPVKLTYADRKDEDEAETIKDVRTSQWLHDVRWAQTRSEKKGKKDGGKIYGTKYSYGGGSTGDITVQIIDEETEKAYEGKYFFVFKDDRWYLEEHMYLVEPPEPEPEQDTPEPEQDEPEPEVTQKDDQNEE